HRFYASRCPPHLYPPSFPTRRSSDLFESYLHDAPLEPPPAPRSPSRTALSWWALLFMTPAVPADAPAWSPGSVLLDSHGLAVLRDRKSTRLNSSHQIISYAVFCLKKK